MSLRPSILAAAILASLGPIQAHSQSDAVRLLIDQGAYWQERGDAVRAADAWQKLLRVDAEQPAALYGLGLIAIQDNQPAKAREYIDRLRALGDKAHADRLEQELALQAPASQENISRARQAVQEQDLDAAVDAYRSALDGREPVGQLGVEYYQALAVQGKDWESARRGLDRLVKSEPTNAHARLALAEILTFRENTRRDGVRQLQALAADPEVGRQANEIWRTGLEWLGDPPAADAGPLFEAYLAANPDDELMRARLATTRRATAASSAAGAAARQAAPPLDPTAAALASAFRALNAGRLPEAEQQFQRLLEARPGLPEAIGGMGLIRLRQERFPEAASLLQQASQGGQAARWRQALQSARYWTLIQEAEALRAADQPAEARQRLEQAVQLDGREPAGQIALATLNLDAGNVDAAVSSLRRLAAQRPRDTNVIQALVVGLTRQQRYDEALSWFERLPAAEQQRLGLGANLRLNQARESLRLAQGRGDADGQRSALANVLRLDPEDGWARLELLRAELQKGNLDQARRQADRLQSSTLQDAEGRAIGELANQDIVAWELQRAQEAADAAERRSDPVARRQALAELLRLDPDSSWTRLELARLDLQEGKVEQAREAAGEIVLSRPDDLEARRVSGIVNDETLAWERDQARQRALQAAERGDKAAQGAAVADWLRLAPENPWANVEWARLALELDDFDGAQRKLNVLQAQATPANPDATQAASLLAGEIEAARLRQARAQAARAAELGDVAGQRQALERVVESSTTDPWARLELARLALREGQVAQAREWVDAPLRAGSQDPDAFYVSALIAAETGEWQDARQRLEAIPAGQLTEPMSRLREETRIQAPLQTIRRQIAAGRMAEARAGLQALDSQSLSPEWRMALAAAYADSGDTARSLAILRDLISRAQPVGAPLLLQYAGLLSSTGQSAELAAVLQQLRGMPLQPAERAGLDNLLVADAVTQADARRNRGDLAGAYDVLAPWLRTRADDPAVTSALARLYLAGQDPGQALALLQPLLAKHPEDLGLQITAANAALQAKNTSQAGRIIDAALQSHPGSADLQAMAAQVYQAQGRRGDAIQALQRAIDLQGGTTGSSATALGGAAVPANPFASQVPAAAQAATPTFAAGPLPVQASLPIPAPAPAQATNRPASGSHQASAASTPAGAPWIAPLPHAAAAPAATAAMLPIPDPVAPLPPGYPAAGAPMPRSLPAPAVRPSAPVPGGVLPVAAPVYPPLAASPAVPVGVAAANATNPTRPYAGAAASPLERQLQVLRAEFSGHAAAGARVRQRDGESGMSSYTGVELPMEALLPVGNGKVALRVTPVTLDAGSVGGDYNTSSRFGSGPAAALAESQGLVGRAGKQSDTGVGIAIAYEGENIKADIGSTPLGMQQTNVVGGVTASARFDNGTTAGVTVSRRAVADSLLSFAGAQDQRTGARWGGVTATGGRFELGYDGGNWGAYGHAGWHALRGHNVVNNTRTEGSVGVYGHVSRDDDHEVTVGLNFTGMGYDKNLRYFTYGHGGYFSPQRFMALSVPVSWVQRQGNLRFGLSGSIGIQNFKEDSARYFPGDENLQAQAQTAAASAAAQGYTSNPSAMYDGQTKTGVGYGLAAAMEYQFGPQWFVGGHASADNARDYREWQAGLYLRYQFDPSFGPQPLPITPLRSPYQP